MQANNSKVLIVAGIAGSLGLIVGFALSSSLRGGSQGELAAVAPAHVAAPQAKVAAPAAPAPYVRERELGHRAFDEGQRLRALHHYERALSFDARAADFQMIDNLVDCYGYRSAQPVAAALIVHHKLHQAEASLARLGHSTARGTRWGAIYTREKLARVPKNDYVQALALDLAGPDCGMHRRAVVALHKLGGPQARQLAERRALAWERTCPTGAPIATGKKTRSTL